MYKRQAQACARKGDEAVAHAERILAQLLLMAKIDAAGSTQLRPPETIDLSSLAQRITGDRVPGAGEAGVDLGFEGQDRALIRAEPLLIGELLRNLIENAIAYAGRGTEVTVRVENHATTVLLEVEDNGPGIPPEKRQVVRQRFARGGHGDAWLLYTSPSPRD